MSEQDRDKLAKKDEDGGDEVEAHRLPGRGANDEGGTDDEGGDDVEAHRLPGR